MHYPKAILALVIFLSFVVVSQAQFHVGVKAGTNVSKIDGKSFKQEFRYNYLVGGFAEIGVGNRISINPEVLFGQSTSTLSDNYKNIYDNVISSDQTRAKLNYLSIPVLLNVKLAGPLHIEAGPQYSILMNSDKNFLENGQDAFKKGDFSLAAGVQLKFSKLRLSGRYVVGMENINNIDNQDQWKNQAIQATLGITLF